MKRLYRKLAFQYSEGGFGRVLRKGFSFVLQRLYSENRWNIYVHRASDCLGATAQPMECRELTYDELVQAGYFKVLVFPEEIRRRFVRENACYGFFSEGKLATIGWRSDGYLELDHGVNYPCEVGLFDFITLPDFRSRGLYANALRYLLKNIHERGSRRIYIAVDPNNISSVRGIRRAGFSPFLLFKRRRVFGIDFHQKSPLDSKLLTDESRPA